MGIRRQFFLNPLDTAHPRKMPAGVLDSFVTAVAHLFGTGKIAEPHHPRAVAEGRLDCAAIQVMAVERLMKPPDEGMIPPQLMPQSFAMKDAFHQHGVQNGVSGITEKIILERNFLGELFHHAGAGNFVDVRHEHEIIGTTIFQPARDGVALKPLHHPRARRSRHVIHDDINNLIVERAEPRAVFLKKKRFGFICKRPCRLDDNEFVHHVGKFVQSQFQQFQLVEKS